MCKQLLRMAVAKGKGNLLQYGQGQRLPAKNANKELKPLPIQKMIASEHGQTDRI